MAASARARRKNVLASRRRRATIHFESLEERLVMSTVSWLSPTDGLWNDPGNWSTGMVPQAGDDVVIARPSADPTVTFVGSGNLVYRSLTVKDRLAIASGVLIVAADSRVDGELALGGGDFQSNAGTLTLSGTTDWTSGRLTGGATRLNLGTMTLSGPDQKSIVGPSFVNQGTIVVSGPLGLGDGGSSGNLDNRASGVIDLHGDVGITDNGQVGSFLNNAGTLRMSAGTYAAVVAQHFDNLGGTVDVRAGTLGTTAGGSSTGGTFDVAAGAELLLGNEGGTGTIAGTYTGSGAGEVALDYSPFATQSAEGATYDFPSGQLRWLQGNIAGSFTNAGSLTVSGGDSKVIDTRLVNTGTFSVDEATTKFTVAGVLDNRPSGLVELVSGFEQILGDPATAKVLNAGTISVASAGDLDLGPSLANTGLVELAGGSAMTASLDGGGDVLKGGTYRIGSGATLNVRTDTLRENDAVVTLEGPDASIPQFSGLSSNTGTLDLGPGASLALPGALSNSGTVSVAAGAVLDVAGMYSQTAAGTTAAQAGLIATTPGAGLVRVVGAALLGGTLAVSQADGASLAAGQSFPILTYASETGDFAAVTGLDAGTAPLFRTRTTPTSVILTTVGTSTDLAVSAVTAPPGPVATGQTATINYAVENRGPEAAAGTWTDSVYLSTDGTLSADDVLLGMVSHTGAVAPGSAYQGVLAATVPALAAGGYRVLVVADSLGRLSDPNRSNNVGASATTLTITVPTFNFGGTVSGTVAYGQAELYRVVVPAATTVVLTLTGEATVSARYGSPPTDSAHDAIGADSSATTQRLTLAAGLGGPVYILVTGATPGTAARAFSLSAAGASFAATSVSPAEGARTGLELLTVRGTGFAPGASVTLVSGATRIPASDVSYQDSATLNATFNLNQAATADYSVEVVDQGRTVVIPGAFRTTEPRVDPSRLPAGFDDSVTVSISTPALSRAGRDQVLTIDYVNRADHAVPAPMILVTASDASLALVGSEASRTTGGLLILGINQDGPAGLLPAGYHGQLTVNARPLHAAAHLIDDYFVQVVPDFTRVPNLGQSVLASPLFPHAADPYVATGVPFDLASSLAGLIPADLATDVRNQVLSNLEADLGNTTAVVRRALAGDATYLSSIGDQAADMAALLQFEFQRATDFGALLARGTLGSMGYGRFTLADSKATLVNGTDVAIRYGPLSLLFSAQPDGTYQPSPGLVATLVRDGSAFRLRTPDGTVTTFNTSDGSFHGLTNPDGSGVVAGYEAGRLTTLTTNLGQVTRIAYNADGRITGLTDPDGGTTQATYDEATGTVLASLTTPSGTQEWAYGDTPATRDAVTRYVDPTGVATSFTYDTEGRLTGFRADGVGLSEMFSYPAGHPGSYIATDGAGDQTEVFRDPSGQVARSVDAEGAVTTTLRDANGQPSRLTLADGAAFSSTFDATGSLLSSTDALGNTSRFDLDPTFHQLVGFRDALGNLTQYTVNTLAQTTSITYADGSKETFAYDAAGRVATEIDRNGLATTQTPAANNIDLASQTYGDGTRATFTYDARHNLLTATNAQGTTAYTYDPANRVTSVAYPNGLSLRFQYDAAGRRTRMIDQAGYTLNYAYDAAGRLTRVADGSGHSLVSYSFDPTGRVALESQSNGTSTASTYDPDGRTHSIITRDASGTVLSSFVYAYDSVGDPLTVTSLQGTTTYASDPDGRLVRASLPGGRTLTYAYDAAGNRVSATDTGATTAYTTNALNEYTSAGSTTYQYDKAGNLLSMTDATGVTRYRYDALERLSSVTSPTLGTFGYIYDAAGTRIATVHDGVRTDDLIDPYGLDKLVGRFQDGGAVDRFVYGFGLAAQVDPSGAASTYSFDALGNTADLTAPDGSIRASYTYLPYGQIASQTGTADNPFTFVGAYGVISDGDGLASMRNRQYDPAAGRFTHPDPTGLAGGLNLYDYADDSPTEYVDPSGLKPVDPVSNLAGSGASNHGGYRPPGGGNGETGGTTGGDGSDPNPEDDPNPPGGPGGKDGRYDPSAELAPEGPGTFYQTQFNPNIFLIDESRNNAFDTTLPQDVNQYHSATPAEVAVDVGVDALKVGVLSAILYFAGPTLLPRAAPILTNTIPFAAEEVAKIAAVFTVVTVTQSNKVDAEPIGKTTTEQRTPTPIPTPPPTPMPTRPVASPIELGRAAFVTSLYRDILGRGPDGVGLESSVADLDAGVKPTAVVADFFKSAERRRLQALHQAPGIASKKALSDALRAGRSAEGQGASSPDPSRLAIVTRLYDEILGRTPDAMGLDFWLDRLDGGTSPAGVARAIFGSAEARSLRSAHEAPRIAEPKALSDALKAGKKAIHLYASIPTGPLA